MLEKQTHSNKEAIKPILLHKISIYRYMCMRKTMLFVMVLIALSIIPLANSGTEKLSLVGKWECSPFIIKEDSFSASGSGMVDFSKSKVLTSDLVYSFSFNGGYHLELAIELIGTWKETGSGFVDTTKDFKIKKMESNLPLSDEQLHSIVRNSFSLNQPVTNIVKFVSDDSFTWSTSSSKKEANCRLYKELEKKRMIKEKKEV